MTASPPLDPIPVYIGDDWSFAFSYREGGGNGAPVDLSGRTIIGTLFPPYSQTPVPLGQDIGLAGLIDGPAGRLAASVTRAMTAAYSASPTGATLRLSIIEEGLLRTIGVWPLWVLSARDQMPAPIVNRIVVDPVSGRTLTFDGPTDLFPLQVSSTDLSVPLSSSNQPHF